MTASMSLPPAAWRHETRDVCRISTHWPTVLTKAPPWLWTHATTAFRGVYVLLGAGTGVVVTVTRKEPRASAGGVATPRIHAATTSATARISLMTFACSKNPTDAGSGVSARAMSVHPTP